jgi:hypothetical protein
VGLELPLIRGSSIRQINVIAFSLFYLPFEAVLWLGPRCMIAPDFISDLIGITGSTIMECFGWCVKKN